MDIFKNLVPLVSIFAPTGREKSLGACEIAKSEYGYSAKFTTDGTSYFIPIGRNLNVKVGESFRKAKAVELAQTGYTHNSTGELVVAKPRPNAQRIWRVTELCK